MSSFKAYRIHCDHGKIESRFERLTLDDLTEGEVVIRVGYSSINYKDALALTGKGKIVRRYPLVGGVDLAGIVESTTTDKFVCGEKVVVIGDDLSVTRDGGYAEFARIPADIIKKLPDGMSLYDSMALGTAGAAAAVAITRMEANGQRPDRGPLIVTGATGGVGGIAIDILSNRGYEVVALTTKSQSVDYLKSLGADKVLLHDEIDYEGSPLGNGRWGGAIDNLGGDVLAWLLSTVRPLGNVVSVGLASGFLLKTTVMPFILRGVSLIGINSSVSAALMERPPLERLATDLKPMHLKEIVSRVVEFENLPKVVGEYLDNTNIGRTIVKIAELD